MHTVTDRDRDFLRRCVELAREAVEHGDEPFGSLLVDALGIIRFEDRNRVSGGDATRHPEFEIARWAAANVQGGGLQAQGAAAYERLGCRSCHGGADAPRLDGLYGSPVRLADGRTVTADEQYLHDAITQPDRVRVQGWPPAMPSYEKAADEETLVALIAYLKAHP